MAQIVHGSASAVLLTPPARPCLGVACGLVRSDPCSGFPQLLLSEKYQILEQIQR